MECNHNWVSKGEGIWSVSYDGSSPDSYSEWFTCSICGETKTDVTSCGETISYIKSK